VFGIARRMLLLEMMPGSRPTLLSRHPVLKGVFSTESEIPIDEQAFRNGKETLTGSRRPMLSRTCVGTYRLPQQMHLPSS
jgi:hypothetical protein